MAMRRPTGKFTLVYSDDPAIDDHLAATTAKKLYRRFHDPAVFTPNTLIVGGKLVRFTCEHLTRGAVDHIDHFMTPNHRKTAAFRCGVVAIDGPGWDAKLDTTKAAWGGKVLSEDAMDTVFGAFTSDCIYEIGEQILVAATFGEPEKKVSPQPSGLPSTESKES